MVNTSRIAFATSCDLNYLAQAHVLAESVKELYPNSVFFLGLNERSLNLKSEIKQLTIAFDQILTGTKLHPKFSELEHRYGVVELCCATKPALLKQCFASGYDYVIYLDPDTFLLTPLNEAIEFLMLEDSDAVFTPHLTKLGNLEMEVSSMKHGILNLGFLGLRRTNAVDNFLNWWDLRLETMCIRDPHRGIFTDQTWAGLALGVLKSKIIHNPGYNFATWNLGDHRVSKKEGKTYVDEFPLVFAHFSSFSQGGIGNFITKYKVDTSTTYLNILDHYSSLVLQSSRLLENVISLGVEKEHYKHRKFYQKKPHELKLTFIDRLNVHWPKLLKFLMWAKSKFKK